MTVQILVGDALTRLRDRIERDAAFPGMAEVAVRDAEPLTLWGEAI